MKNTTNKRNKNKIEDMEVMIDRINQDSKQLIDSESKTTVYVWFPRSPRN